MHVSQRFISEKEMAASVLAWETPRTEKPGGLVLGVAELDST